MCGILWALLEHTTRSDDVLQEHFAKLSHRGPDASNWEIVRDTHFVGNHRLAIINPTPEGNQPFHHANGDVLICNGQLYNYQDLVSVPLRSDVEAILHLRSQQPMEQLVPSLDGDFAFVLVTSDDTVYIVRDPVGVRPLFYGVNEHETVICTASEAKAIIGMPGVVECRVFPPGSIYSSATGAFVQYTSIYPKHDEIRSTCSYTDAVAIVRERLTDAVKKRIHNSDRPIAFLCSGGIDSSIVLALAHTLAKERKLHMFSIEYDHPGSRSDDTFYASMLAAQLGVAHTVVKFTWADAMQHLERIISQIETYDPNTIRASVPMYFLAKYIRENTEYKVILSGEGADELFMGYNIFSKVVDPNAANEETQRLVRNLHMFDVLRADRTFAAHGLELRVPFLDKDLIYDVFRIHGTHKMQSNSFRMEKQLLRDAFADIPELRNTRILERGKERFSDGCGFGYVPSLLNHWTSASDLVTKEKAEREAYRVIFDKIYPEHAHLITKRVNPAWCPNTANAAITSFV